MSKRKATLALAYLKDHPKSAARTLELAPPSEIASFLAETPAPFAVPVVAHMLPHVAARACRLMPVDAAASLLSLLEPVTIAAIFRYLPPELRQKLQTELPSRKRRASGALLGYSQNAVGSWMIPDAPVLPSDGKGAQAQSIIETMEGSQKADHLFAIDRDRHLVGRIHISDALSLKPEQEILPALKLDCRALNGRTRLEQAAEHPDWDTYDVMPIVGPNNRYNGSLRHVDLRRGLRHLAKMARSRDLESGIGNNLSDYLHSLLSTLSGMAHMIDSDTRSP